MKHKRIAGAAFVAGAILALAALTSTPATAHERGGQGHGMMGRGGKSGCGPGAMGGSAVDKELSVEDVTKILEGRLAWRGNDRLKVGKVEEKDEKTIIAEIVTVDDSLVKRLEFDRKTGRHRRIR